MNNKHKINLELLGQIQKVNAPPFLLTRIKQKIENINSAKFSTKTSWMLAVSFCVLLCFNLIIIFSAAKKSNHEDNLAHSMHLLPDNSLYK